MRNLIFALVLSTFAICGCGHSVSEKDPACWITDEERDARIAIDFNRDSAYIVNYLKEFYPELTAEQVASWEASNALENMVINGQKRYFKNAGRNLFRIDREAKAVYEAKTGETDGEGDFTAETIATMKEVIASGKNCVNPVEFTKTFRMTVDADAVPAGKTVRVWMPYPREDQSSITDVKLIATSQPDYIIAPDEYAHKSIYMEKTAVAGEPTVFTYTFSFKTAARWFFVTPDNIKPYDTGSELYRTYTSERDRHVIFTDELKALTAQVVGSETNPYLKAKAIFDWILENIPWASSREYSTMDNIPMYVINNMHGDCGMMGLLYITMCRIAGVPARWQSGWTAEESGCGMHDWCETYYEGIGWVPTDPSYGHHYKAVNIEGYDCEYYLTGIDRYRLICNSDYGQPFYPAKKFIRSETVDFQRGEVEWEGGNLYFNQWTGWFDN